MMKFHRLVSENMLVHFLPENGTLQLHFWYNSLNFEASLIFYKDADLAGASNAPMEYALQTFPWKIHCFKDEPFVEFETRLNLNDCTCIFQRVIPEMELECAIFRQKVQ